MRAVSFVLALCLALAPLLPTAEAQRAPLVGRLRALLQEAALGDEVGVAVLDIGSGRMVFEHRANRPLNPASNMKLVTAATALSQLGPGFTMSTGAYGRAENGRVPEIVLRGFGDPTLTRGGLAELAHSVADQGVRRVGRVRIDASYFDDQVLPPAFDQQPREVAAFRAAVSAVSVDRNAYVLRVLPGREVGAPAIVRLAGSPYFDVDNAITTAEPGNLNVIADQRDVSGRMRLRLRGSVPTGIRGVSYSRRIIHPRRWAGELFREALVAAGIETGETVVVGAGGSDLPLLAARRSPPLSAMLPAMGKRSDNFTAEMLFKVLGAERHRPGRAEDAVRAVRAFLEEADIANDRLTIVNGSGLFDGNRVSAAQLAQLCALMYRDSALRPEFVGHLAVGGVDGTLRRRLRNLPAPRIVRAKTGTLAAVIGLSGYVLGPTPDSAYAFSFLANDVRGRQGQARAVADDIVRALAEHLHR